MDFEIENDVLTKYTGNEREVIVPEGVTEIADRAFFEAAELESVKLPASLKQIGDYAFYGCKGLKRVEVLGAMRIGTYAFGFCDQLEEVILSDDVTQIDRAAFYCCKSLTNIHFPKGLSKLSKEVFSSCGFKEIVIPETVCEIEAFAFNNCKNAERIILPEGIKIVNGYAFKQSPNLKEFVIPASVEEFDSSAVPLSVEKLTIKCGWRAIKTFGFKVENYKFSSIYMAEEDVKLAKPFFKGVSYFNLNGEPIQTARKPAACKASKPKAAPAPVAAEEIVVSYPSNSPDMTTPIEAYLIKDGAAAGLIRPTVKEIQVQMGKWQFKLSLRVAGKYPSIWARYCLNKDERDYYDPRTVLGKATNSTGYIDERTGVFIASPLQNNIPKGIAPLSTEEVHQRVGKFITAVNGCVLEDAVKVIMTAVQRKKDGKLMKGRLLHLAFLDLVDETGETIEFIAKNEDDLILILF